MKTFLLSVLGVLCGKQPASYPSTPSIYPQEPAMPSGVYLIQDNGQLVEMTPQPPPNEDHLQRLIADYPNLLAGDQINPTVPRRWLLISREVYIASEPGGGPRWPVDHLFLDQDGIPTLVEVKRASDPRIHREVVGQLLEYASNAANHWPIKDLNSLFRKTCDDRHLDPDEVMRTFLKGETPNDFWRKVQANLEVGRLRLIFVADIVPPELRRIVEYLNQQMNPTEVLAVEVRQYAAGEGTQRVLTSEVMGSIEPTSFFPTLAARYGSQAVATARALMDWAILRRCQITWGKGFKSESFFPVLKLPSGYVYTFGVSTDQTVEIQFQYTVIAR